MNMNSSSSNNKWAYLFDNYEASLYSENNSSIVTDNFLLNVLRGTDVFVRCYTLFIHVLYFVIIFKKRELRQLSYTFVHNVNLIGLFFVAHYCFYLFSSRPNTTVPMLNEILCRISEVTWAASKYLSTYSVLLLAYTRYMAVCRIETYKRVIKSKFYVYSSLLILWLFSFSIAITTKYIFRTRAGRILCYDGYSINVTSSVYYYIFIACVAIIIPSVTVLYLYAMLLHRLKQISKRVGNKIVKRKVAEKWSNAIEYSRQPPKYTPTDGNSNSSLEKQPQNRKFIQVLDEVLKKSSLDIKRKSISARPVRSASLVREQPPQEQRHAQLARQRSINNTKGEANQKTQAKQLIILSVVICFSTIAFLLLNVGNLLNQYNKDWFYFRLIIRILVIFLQSFIPIISLIFHPIMSKTLKTLFKCNGNKIGIVQNTVIRV